MINTKVYTADWLLPVSSPPIKDGALVVKGSEIIDVGPRLKVLSRLRDQDDCKMISLGEAAILPGLINVHTHLELTIMRGFLENLGFRDWILTLTGARRQLSNEHLKASAIWGACEAARAGITTLADTGKSGTALDGLLTVGLRGIVYQEVFGLKPSEVEENFDGLRRNVETLSARANGLVRVGVSPHAPYSVAAQLFTKVARYAVAEDLPIAIHTAESVAEELLIREGRGEFVDNMINQNIDWTPPRCSIIQYLDSIDVLSASPLLIHCIRLSDGDLNLIIDSDSKVAHCPKSNAKFGHGRAGLREMIEAGVRVGIGTDSVASNNICDLLDEGRVCALVHGCAESRAIEARTIIDMMTRGGAEVLGMAGEVGTLEVGKQADFISVDLNDSRLLPIHDIEAAIVYCAAGRDVRLTVVAGKEVYKDGMLTDVDEDAVRVVLKSGAQVMRGRE
jgi:cytosine/adenosine deaminase-related metal-dependent hydrolase